MKKRVLCSLLVILLVLSCFGCAKTETSKETASSETTTTTEASSGQTKELSVWMPPFGTGDTMDKEFWEAQFDAFEAEYGVTVDVQIISWSNYPEKYMAGSAGGNGPDVGYLYADIFPDFIEMGAIQDIGDLITDHDREIYPYLEEGFILGKQYALPFIMGNPRVIYYNKAILAEAGIEAPTEPITWDAFIDIAKTVTQDTDGDGTVDQWAAAMGWGATSYGIMQETFTPFLLQAGGELFADDGKTATFGSEAGIRAAQFVHDLIYVHEVMPKTVTGMTHDDCMTMFNNGETAFMFAATADAVEIDETIDWGFIPCLEDEIAATMSVADQLVLMSDCEDRELGYALIQYMLSPEVQAAFHTQVSPYPPVNLEESYNDNPLFEELFTQQADLLKTEKPVSGAYKISDYLYKNLQLVMMDEMSAEEALTQAEEYANTVMQE